MNGMVHSIVHSVLKTAMSYYIHVHIDMYILNCNFPQGLTTCILLITNLLIGIHITT